MNLLTIAARWGLSPESYMAGLGLLTFVSVGTVLWIGLADTHKEREHAHTSERMTDHEQAAAPQRSLYQRQIEAQIPPRHADPWANLWWQTLTRCRRWYHQTALQSPVKISRQHPTMQAYQRALRRLRRRHLREAYWYHGSVDIVAGHMMALVGFCQMPLIGGISILLIVFDPHSLSLASLHRILTMLSILSGLSGLAWLYHTLSLWWVAGPPWWDSERRMRRILGR